MVEYFSFFMATFNKLSLCSCHMHLKCTNTTHTQSGDDCLMTKHIVSRSDIVALIKLDLVSILQRYLHHVSMTFVNQFPDAHEAPASSLVISVILMQYYISLMTRHPRF